MKHPAILLLLASLAAYGCGGAERPDHARLERNAADAALSMGDVPAAPAAPSGARPDFTTTSVGGAEAADDVPQPGTMPGEPAVSLDPMLIRTGQAVLRVDSLEEGIARVRRLAQQSGGIVGNTTISGGTDAARRAEIELRIPSAAFDRVVGGLSPIGTVQSVNVTAEDVGEEYTDVSARVANARRLEARLLALLDTRSGRLEEVLNLEREIARVREEIERYEGRLRYLRSRAAISILTVTLHEGGGFARGGRDGLIVEAFGMAWRSFVTLLAGFIASLGVLIPLLFAAWGAWRAIRWIRRRDAVRDARQVDDALRRERAAPAETDPQAGIP